MSVYDPYLGSAIRPNNAQSHLWNYALGGAGLGPTSPTFSVPNPTAPYRGVGGNFVGMDTAPGRVGRDIDLEKLNNRISSDYVGVDPTKQQVVTHEDNKYVIGKDQKVDAGEVVDKKAPTGIWRNITGAVDAITGVTPWKTDYDMRSGPDIGKTKDQLPTKIEDAQTTRKKTASDRVLEQADLQRAYHLKNQPMYDAMHNRNMEVVNQIAENQMARDLNYLKQAYPLAQAAAWDATQRSLYGDKYSTSAAQRRAAEAAGAEATMYAAVAQQANAAANLRGSYRGKNIGFG